MGRGNFDGERRSIVKYRDTLRSSVQKQLNVPIEMPFGLWTGLHPSNLVFDGSYVRWGFRSPMGRGNYKGEGRPVIKYGDTLP